MLLNDLFTNYWPQNIPPQLLQPRKQRAWQITCVLTSFHSIYRAIIFHLSRDVLISSRDKLEFKKVDSGSSMGHGTWESLFARLGVHFHKMTQKNQKCFITVRGMPLKPFTRIKIFIWGEGLKLIAGLPRTNFVNSPFPYFCGKIVKFHLFVHRGSN